ncbi:hypothetical protein [Alteribacter keqinensis]|uniref:Uncharacterized protein n=1 Tax=Alteribacter keqinensis TaxID=2483800 RepID=A0A3M7TSA2_9BACI|nr:hypothetical protein [Alteribacter keqinensis]RNA68538.1 hypothetical protein EBO34_00765 [Alteribacter keqinensis]
MKHKVALLAFLVLILGVSVYSAVEGMTKEGEVYTSFTFQGESESWKVEASFVRGEDGVTHARDTIRFNHKEGQPPRNFTVSVMTPERDWYTGTGRGVLVFKGEAFQEAGMDLTPSNRRIMAVIDWDGEHEIVNLAYVSGGGPNETDEGLQVNAEIN